MSILYVKGEPHLGAVMVVGWEGGRGKWCGWRAAQHCLQACVYHCMCVAMNGKWVAGVLASDAGWPLGKQEPNVDKMEWQQVEG